MTRRCEMISWCASLGRLYGPTIGSLNYSWLLHLDRHDQVFHLKKAANEKHRFVSDLQTTLHDPHRQKTHIPNPCVELAPRQRKLAAAVRRASLILVARRSSDIQQFFHT